MDISITPMNPRPVNRYGANESRKWLWSLVDTSTRNSVVMESGESDSYSDACEHALTAFNNRMFGKENG